MRVPGFVPTYAFLFEATGLLYTYAKVKDLGKVALCNGRTFKLVERIAMPDMDNEGICVRYGIYEVAS